MSEKLHVPTDKKLQRILYEMNGLAMAVTALGGDEPKSTLPGFALARALIDKELADHRAQFATGSYRCAAKAGHDVSKIAGVSAEVKDGEFVIVLTPADLVDQAEDA